MRMKTNKFQISKELFISFFQIGLFTFGGGLAMLPLLTKQVVETKHWATEEELLNYFAIGQCTPGIIAVNTATFVGYKTAGILGAAIATLGIITPSIIIILLVANALQLAFGSAAVIHAFSGVRVAVTALIAATVVKLFKSNVKGYLKIAIAVIAFVSVALFNVSPIIITLLAALAGIAFLGGKHE